MRTHNLHRRSVKRNRNPLRKAKWAIFILLILVSLFAYTNAYQNPIWPNFNKPAQPEILTSQNTQPTAGLPKIVKQRPLPQSWDDSEWIADLSPFIAGFKDADFFGAGKLVALNDQFDLPNEDYNGFLMPQYISALNQLMLTTMARDQNSSTANR